ncbi:N-acetyltransferase [Gordonia malaquae]|uniref:hypothetical protein n=1 Tax=Gordonia malaquae TaxID=410332 RepID=UPI0012FBEDAE|nr:hypothetical protein [Gordonia malaquae]
MAADEILLIGEVVGVPAAVCHLHFEIVGGRLEVFVKSIAVAVAHRGVGGEIAGRLLSELHREAGSFAGENSVSVVVLMAKTNTSNLPIQRLLKRFGWEPFGPPEHDLQMWMRTISV